MVAIGQVPVLIQHGDLYIAFIFKGKFKLNCCFCSIMPSLYHRAFNLYRERKKRELSMTAPQLKRNKDERRPPLKDLLNKYTNTGNGK
jgi:hypothetical protein